ncbi:hypothetical protein KCU73_g8128, partial [Aureobasidium melanogenum]
MSTNAPPRFDLLNNLPREIRDMIFGYMVQNTLNRHVPQPNGFRIHTMRSHLITSPWFTLNKQHCVEYLKVFLRSAEMVAEIRDPWVKTCQQDIDFAPNPIQLEDSLQLINRRFAIAARDTGTKAPREALFPYTKGICFSFYYYGDFFKIGFGKWDSRKYPSKDCFVKPAKELRRYYGEFNIPSGRLSIYIWYGDPSESILACLQTLDKIRHSVESPPSLHARIFVNDYDASVLTIDSELDVLRKAFWKDH